MRLTCEHIDDSITYQIRRFYVKVDYIFIWLVDFFCTYSIISLFSNLGISKFHCKIFFIAKSLFKKSVYGGNKYSQRCHWLQHAIVVEFLINHLEKNTKILPISPVGKSISHLYIISAILPNAIFLKVIFECHSVRNHFLRVGSSTEYRMLVFFFRQHKDNSTKVL